MRRAKSRGFSDVLYLDAETGKNIEEVSASNIFLVKVKQTLFKTEVECFFLLPIMMLYTN